MTLKRGKCVDTRKWAMADPDRNREFNFIAIVTIF
jgi:hypothetical protein